MLRHLERTSFAVSFCTLVLLGLHCQGLASVDAKAVSAEPLTKGQAKNPNQKSKDKANKGAAASIGEAQKLSLGPPKEFTCEGLTFALSVPKSFGLVATPSEDSPVFGWNPDKRPDGSAPLIIVMALPKTPDVDSPDKFIENWYKSTNLSGASTKKTPTDSMTINGRPFRYVKYKRVANGHSYDGFMAVTQTKNGLMAMSGQDVAGQKATFDACWASLMSFKSSTK